MELAGLVDLGSHQRLHTLALSQHPAAVSYLCSEDPGPQKVRGEPECSP